MPNLQVEVAAVPNFMLKPINFSSEVSGHSIHLASNAVITPKSTQIWRKPCKNISVSLCLKKYLV